MAKNESTAINDLIQLVQGRIVDHGSGDDYLFVTKQPSQQHLVPSGPPPAPLPRRRAPSATPAALPISDYDDDAATQVDPMALQQHFAQGSAPAPLPMPIPIVPQYAYPTPPPLPLPPIPSYPPLDTIPVPRPSFEEHLETVRVVALPPPELEPPSRTAEVVDLLKKLALPFGGLAVLLMFVGGAIVHSGQGGHKRNEAPVVMAVTPAPKAAAGVEVTSPVEPPPAAAAAVATEAPPTVASDGTAIGWKPQVVQPTLGGPAPVEEVAVAEPAEEAAPAEEADEIEMDATNVVKRSKRSSSRSSRRAARVAVVVPAPKSPKPAKAERAPKGDPVALAIAAPTKSAKSTAKGTGPGKITITSTPAALIYIDGRSTNQMTPKTVSLAPGMHKITLLEVTTRKAKTQEVDVAAGGSHQVAKKF